MSMNIQFTQYEKVITYLALFYPHVDFTFKDLNKRDSEKVLTYLFHILDALFKGENFYKKRNLVLPEGGSFFPGNSVGIIENINSFLYKFTPKAFSFSRTECQTFIFIVENVLDYFKNVNYYVDKRDKKNLFIDYRFWIENFFKVFDQKITGAVFFNKKPLNFKNIFNKDDSLVNTLTFANSNISYSLFPFVINRDGVNLFLHKITPSGLIYLDVISRETVSIDDEDIDKRVFEFLLANFNFEDMTPLKRRIDLEEHPQFQVYTALKESFRLNQEKLFEDSKKIADKLTDEPLGLPLFELLQIENMVRLNRFLEVKKQIQNFSLRYPYYADAYEMLADIYSTEGKHEHAVNLYEKVLKMIQNKRVTDKLKKEKDTVEKTKSKPAKQVSENDFDITDNVLEKREILIPRPKELRQLVEILLSRSRRNALLVGDSGVGKTALIRMLALDILQDEVPEALKNKRIKEINFINLLTGSKYRGQFEEKILKYLTDFKSQDAILVLENIHLMISTGTARGTSMDLVNILKPFLRDNSIQVIATTNYEEFKNNLEKDHTLMGFFQRISVNEMSVEDSRRILSNLAKESFEKDNCLVEEGIIESIIDNAKINIKEKKLPDSAIMIFERCLAKVKYKVYSGEENKVEVNQGDVVEVLADILNLQESNISLSMKSRLQGLRAKILERIVGQDEAIDRITASIMTSKLEFDLKRNRPDGVFLFIGPTGVGKTETALALAEALYGSEDFLIRIDMSEYMEKFTYSRFVGAAPGYVGYYDSNQLTDKVRQNPFSVILLDEIEKADSQLMNIFLQVFDAGRLTDARGNNIDFSHTTIVMTSNIGTSLFSQSQMGYHGDLQSSDISRTSLIKLLKKHFSLEFLNRIDEILIFKHLHADEIKLIIDILLKETRERLEKQNKELVLPDNVVQLIIKKGYSKEYGARNIARFIKGSILEQIARLSLEKGWDAARYVVCSIENDDIEVNLQSADTPPDDEAELIEKADAKANR